MAIYSTKQAILNTSLTVSQNVENVEIDTTAMVSAIDNLASLTLDAIEIIQKNRVTTIKTKLKTLLDNIFSVNSFLKKDTKLLSLCGYNDGVLSIIGRTTDEISKKNNLCKNLEKLTYHIMYRLPFTQVEVKLDGYSDYKYFYNSKTSYEIAKKGGTTDEYETVVSAKIGGQLKAKTVDVTVENHFFPSGFNLNGARLYSNPQAPMFFITPYQDFYDDPLTEAANPADNSWSYQANDLRKALNVEQNVSNYTVSGQTVKITTTNDHDLLNGDLVVIYGMKAKTKNVSTKDGTDQTTDDNSLNLPGNGLFRIDRVDGDNKSFTIRDLNGKSTIKKSYDSGGKVGILPRLNQAGEELKLGTEAPIFNDYTAEMGYNKLGIYFEANSGFTNKIDRRVYNGLIDPSHSEWEGTNLFREKSFEKLKEANPSVSLSEYNTYNPNFSSLVSDGEIRYNKLYASTFLLGEGENAFIKSSYGWIGSNSKSNKGAHWPYNLDTVEIDVSSTDPTIDDKKYLNNQKVSSKTKDGQLYYKVGSSKKDDNNTYKLKFSDNGLMDINGARLVYKNSKLQVKGIRPKKRIKLTFADSGINASKVIGKTIKSKKDDNDDDIYYVIEEDTTERKFNGDKCLLEMAKDKILYRWGGDYYVNGTDSDDNIDIDDPTNASGLTLGLGFDIGASYHAGILFKYTFKSTLTTDFKVFFGDDLITLPSPKNTSKKAKDFLLALGTHNSFKNQIGTSDYIVAISDDIAVSKYYNTIGKGALHSDTGSKYQSCSIAVKRDDNKWILEFVERALRTDYLYKNTTIYNRGFSKCSGYTVDITPGTSYIEGNFGTPNTSTRNAYGVLLDPKLRYHEDQYLDLVMILNQAIEYSSDYHFKRRIVGNLEPGQTALDYDKDNHTLWLRKIGYNKEKDANDFTFKFRRAFAMQGKYAYMAKLNLPKKFLKYEWPSYVLMGCSIQNYRILDGDLKHMRNAVNGKLFKYNSAGTVEVMNEFEKAMALTWVWNKFANISRNTFLRLFSLAVNSKDHTILSLMVNAFTAGNLGLFSTKHDLLKNYHLNFKHPNFKAIKLIYRDYD